MQNSIPWDLVKEKLCNDKKGTPEHSKELKLIPKVKS